MFLRAGPRGVRRGFGDAADDRDEQGLTDMKNLAYAFTLFFVTLGPVKTMPAFFLLTHKADQRTIWLLALKGTVVATGIALFIALIASGILEKWTVSVDSVAISGGIMLLITSIKALTVFSLIDIPAVGTAHGEEAEAGEPHTRESLTEMHWLGKPVLSPIAIPIIITPIGVVAILFFAGQAAGDDAFKLQLIEVLLVIMAMNLVAMILAGPIMRSLGLPILEIIGWVFSALQAGLAVQAILAALRRLHIVP
jgi:multiple antibiotic resistance protein